MALLKPGTNAFRRRVIGRDLGERHVESSLTGSDTFDSALPNEVIVKPVS